MRQGRKVRAGECTSESVREAVGGRVVVVGGTVVDVSILRGEHCSSHTSLARSSCHHRDRCEYLPG